MPIDLQIAKKILNVMCTFTKTVDCNHHRPAIANTINTIATPQLQSPLTMAEDTRITAIAEV